MGFKLNLCAVLLAVTVGYIVYTTPPWPPAASHRWLKYLTGTYLRFMTLMVSIRCSIATALEIRNGVQTERVCRTADSDCGLHCVHHPDMATYCQSPLAEVLDRFMAFMMRLLCDTRFWIRFKLNSKPTMMLQPASIYIAADWTKRESLCPVHRKSRDIRLFFLRYVPIRLCYLSAAATSTICLKSTLDSIWSLGFYFVYMYILFQEQRLRSTWAPAQSYQSLRHPHGGKPMPYLPVNRTTDWTDDRADGYK